MPDPLKVQLPDDATEMAFSNALHNIVNAGSKIKNYPVDIAGDLGVGVRAPTLTNLPNTFILSSHGGPLSGFSVDKSATNEMAKIVRDRIDQGKQLTVEDIASKMGSATNDVKRAIIDACYAAGYNFKDVKAIFPNLEQLVAPSTDKPTSASYDRDLTRPSPSPAPHTLKELSPLFSITPSSTNIISQSSDWLPKKEAQSVAVPLSPVEKEMDTLMQRAKKGVAPVWFPTNYNPKGALPADVYKQRMADALAWQKEALKHAKNSADIDAIESETKRRISGSFQ